MMENQIILSVLSPYILLAIGVFLIAFEAIVTSFFLIWFGIGFLITALISVYYPFSDGVWQVAVSCIIALVLLFLLREKATNKFLNSSEEISDNFFEGGGIGQIKNGKVFFKGTYWEIDSVLDDVQFSEGEKVNVIKAYKNFAKIEKK